MTPPDSSQPLTPNFDTATGLIPVVVQDRTSREVLMLAYMDQAAWEQTLATGVATYFSRSRKRLWTKGETSGHIQRVERVRIDCDADTILLEVEQVGGAACHDGYVTCFYRETTSDGYRVVAERIFDPQHVYKTTD